MTTKSALRFVGIVRTFALCVRGSVRAIRQIAMRFVSYVRTFAMRVLPNVKNFQRTIAARNVQQLAKNARRLVRRKFLELSNQVLIFTQFENFLVNYCQILRGSFLSVFGV